MLVQSCCGACRGNIRRYSNLETAELRNGLLGVHGDAARRTWYSASTATSTNGIGGHPSTMNASWHTGNAGCDCKGRGEGGPNRCSNLEEIVPTLGFLLRRRVVVDKGAGAVATARVRHEVCEVCHLLVRAATDDKAGQSAAAPAEHYGLPHRTVSAHHDQNLRPS